MSNHSAIPSIEATLQAAAEAQRRGENWHAVELYTELLGAINPQTADPLERQGRLTALAQRGHLLYLMGEQVATLACYEQYRREAATNEQLVEAMVLLGNQFTYMGRTREALRAQRQGLSLAKQIGYTMGQAKTLGGLGRALLNMGQSNEAMTYLLEAQSLFEQLKDTEQQAIGWNRIGVAYRIQGAIDKAIQAYKTCVKLSHKLERTDISAHSLGNIAECYQLLFDMDQALSFYDEALKLTENWQLSTPHIDIMRGRGVSLCYLGRVDEGLSVLRNALTLAQRVNQLDLKMQVLYSLALACLDEGLHEEAAEHAATLETLALAQESRNHQARAYYVSARCFQTKGNLTKAEELWQQAIFLAHETGQRYLLWHIHAGLAQISNPALASVHYRIAAEIIDQIADPIDDEQLSQQFLNAPPVKAILEASPPVSSRSMRPSNPADLSLSPEIS